MKDLRNALAKARGKFFENEGKRLENQTSLGLSNFSRQYVHNRLESAFIAGWNACEEQNQLAERKG